MIVLKLNVSKIPKGRIFNGQKGKYLDLALVDKPDEYGNDGFVKIDLNKAARDAGEKGEIIGNWKHVGGKPAPKPQPQPRPQQKPAPDPDLDADDDSEVPF